MVWVGENEGQSFLFICGDQKTLPRNVLGVPVGDNNPPLVGHASLDVVPTEPQLSCMFTKEVGVFAPGRYSGESDLVSQHETLPKSDLVSQQKTLPGDVLGVPVGDNNPPLGEHTSLVAVPIEPQLSCVFTKGVTTKEVGVLGPIFLKILLNS